MVEVLPRGMRKHMSRVREEARSIRRSGSYMYLWNKDSVLFHARLRRDVHRLIMGEPPSPEKTTARQALYLYGRGLDHSNLLGKGVSVVANGAKSTAVGAQQWPVESQKTLAEQKITLEPCGHVVRGNVNSSPIYCPICHERVFGVSATV